VIRIIAPLGKQARIPLRVRPASATRSSEGSLGAVREVAECMLVVPTGTASATECGADYTPRNLHPLEGFPASTPWRYAIPNDRLGRDLMSVLLVRTEELRADIPTTSKLFQECAI